MTDLLPRPDLHRQHPRPSGGSTTSDRRAPRRSRTAALVLACLALMSVDAVSGDASPVEPARRVLGEVYAPVAAVVDTLLAPLLAVPSWVRTQDGLRDEVARLGDENAALRGELSTVDLDRQRLAEYDGLTATAQQIGYALVPAHVIGVGPAQTFSRTVTIDAGARAGVRADQTVVSAAGLVGRVLRVTDTTATVLLVIDAESVVGGRLTSTMRIGFLHGRGDLADFGRGARLDLELLDQTDPPAAGDTVTTWGSDQGAPYVAGVPVGVVRSAYVSVRDSTKRAVIEPFVDFGSLDLVGVVVTSGADSDRAVIEPDGGLR